MGQMQQDGSARGDPGATDCGGLFQNKFAAYLACFTANLGVRNSLYEEIMGAILAIELVEHKGWRYLWPECDSLLTIQASQNYHLVTHTYVEDNSCANKLASCARDSSEFCWWDSPLILLEQNSIGMG
ncbi:hypothetical protein GmHk_07G019913 [Glycine max]|uniref:RNase H type-1 domain-containing protein n=1 Tax=Glycine soja TaxID=3848 RepID=A0A445JY13_GLYSO|nr:hypothetical protein GmHk_07G019913 [Glycine max]RZC03386.1 hypothetical protein D0Y65_018170 [Glycine soja]